MDDDVHVPLPPLRGRPPTNQVGGMMTVVTQHIYATHNACNAQCLSVLV